MWKYMNTEKSNEFLLSLNLITLDLKNEDKLKYLYTISNNVDSHYTHKKIRKRNGKVRNLYVPDYLLKHIQYNILHNVLEGFSVSKYAIAYIKEKNIKDNAKPHVNNKIILKMDIKDFFENITFLMIYQKAFKGIYFPDSVRGVLTSLCCYDDHLPQGASTSSYISNLILKPFDEYIGAYAEKRNINYTRYCDDMTFSGDFNVKEVISKVTSFLNEMGFEINKEKTKVLTKGTRQIVTGVVVNEKIQVSRKYRKNLRLEYYYFRKNGNLNEKDLLSLLGKVNYVLSINPNDKYFKEAKKLLVKELKGKK